MMFNINMSNHFSQLPSVDIRRTKFDESCDHKTTFDSGKLIPFFLQLDVLPGSTHLLDSTNISVRLSSPLTHPIMDDIILDTYYFFVPYRLVWDELEEFFGENDDPWTQNKNTVRVPHITNAHMFLEGSPADYMGAWSGIVSDGPNATVNCLQFRGLAKIWNDWFRSEIVDTACYIHKDSLDRPCYTSEQAPANLDYISGVELGQVCPPVSKFSDYFTTALPQPQRGPDVFLPLNGSAPVVPGDLFDDTLLAQILELNRPMQLYHAVSNGSNQILIGSPSYANTNNVVNVYSGNAPSGVSPQQGNYTFPANLYADLQSATAASVNQLRQALAIQRFYEASARFGTRYTEILRGHFGVVSPDARLQRSEYLGGERMNLNIQQVLQTSSTDQVTPQGNTSAYSWTISHQKGFSYTATEHGMIIGVCCVRTPSTYQYGVERGFHRRDIFDFYWPQLNNIGEVPVYNNEIYMTGQASDKEVFGYQEYAADYRWKKSRVSGKFRSSAEQSLDVWHLAEDFESLPTLSPEFMHQKTSLLDRVLAVSSELNPQILMQAYFNYKVIQPMSANSIPGLGGWF